MPKPITVSIPHQLGKAEAIRRLQGGMGTLKQKFGGQIGALQDTWTDDRMDFRVVAMGQTVTGHLQVHEDSVFLEVNLPFLLAMIADKVRPFVEKQGRLMLEKK